jgi:hypothetical protein
MGLFGRTLVGLGFVLACTTATGCSDQVERRDGRYQVRMVRVTDRSSSEEHVTREAIKQALGGAFDAEVSFALASEQEGLAAELWFAEQPGPSGARDLIVGLRVQTPSDLRPMLGEDGLEANVLLERESGQASLAQDIGLAIGRAVSVLEARVGLARGDERRVNQLLASEDPELVLLALEWIRDRRSSGNPDAVAALLTHADERVGLLAIEALGTIGGPEHVHALLRGVRLADPGQAHRAYEALASLGGPDAQAFLEFAARNEDEQERRQAAARALGQVIDGVDPSNVVNSPVERPPVRGHRQ